MAVTTGEAVAVEVTTGVAVADVLDYDRSCCGSVVLLTFDHRNEDGHHDDYHDCCATCSNEGDLDGVQGIQEG